MSTAAEVEHRNQDATAYVGNLDDAVTEELIWELCLQAGPVTSVHMPKDKVTGSTQGYGFVEFRTENDADYAVTVLNMIKLYGKPIRVNKSSQDRKSNDVGANLFIGNLDDSVDEKLLYDTFSAFGGITNTPKIMRDLETGNSKGFGFVSYDSFEASDLAIECMNGQFLCNKAISVGYAYKKESKGERHGSQAERLLAASRPEALKPHTMFAAAAGGPGGVGGGIGGAPRGPPGPPPAMGGAYAPMGGMMGAMGGAGAGGAPPPPPPPPPPGGAAPPMQQPMGGVRLFTGVGGGGGGGVSVGLC